VSVHGAYAALVVRRVERLAPPRPYLTGLSRGRTAEPEQSAVDELRTVLRMANEYVLADLVARPMRSRLTELERQLAARDDRVRELEERLGRARARAAGLESSATYRVGQAMVRGARNPAVAVVAVPRDLARIWRDRRAARRRGAVE
jgi:hypothetical protein